jgi:3-phosphoglycerate kinase
MFFKKKTEAVFTDGCVWYAFSMLQNYIVYKSKNKKRKKENIKKLEKEGKKKF